MRLWFVWDWSDWQWPGFSPLYSIDPWDWSSRIKRPGEWELGIGPFHLYRIPRDW